MHPIDFDLELLSEAGYDWRYARSALRDRDTGKPFPASPAQEPRGSATYGVNPEDWAKMTPEQQAQAQAEYEASGQKFQARQSKWERYRDRLDAAMQAYNADQAASAPAAPVTPPTPTPPPPLPSDAPPGTVAKVGRAATDDQGASQYYVDKNFNQLGPTDASVGTADELPYSPWDEPDYHKWPKGPEKPAEEPEPSIDLTKPQMPRFRGPDREIKIVDTPEGFARQINVDLTEKPGYIVIDDRYPEIPLDGPYVSEIQAQEEMKRYGLRLAGERIKELEDAGRALTPEEKYNLRERVLDRMSYRFYDPDKEPLAKLPPGRKYEYGEMRSTQLALLQKKDDLGHRWIQEIKDDNPDSTYLDGKAGSPNGPNLDRLKKVWCPLILDQAEPPRRPWSPEQVIISMYPVMSRMARKWVGHGFSEGEAIAVCLTATMKAMLNDRGMSPFVAYARKWMYGDLYKAKKKAGVMPRALRDKGWGNQGATSTETPLIGAEGTEDGTIGGTVPSSTPSFEKITCPDCGGTRLSADEPPEVCTYCQGTGKNADGTTCGLCKGVGAIKRPCFACGGTGRIVLATRDEELRNKGLRVYKDENGNYQVSGNIEGLEKQALLEKLNRAGRLIEKLMDVAKLTPDQRDIINLRFGLKTGREYGTTDIARMLKSQCMKCGRINLDLLDHNDNLTTPILGKKGVCPACGPQPSPSGEQIGTLRSLGTKQGVELNLKKILTKLRKTILAIANYKYKANPAARGPLDAKPPSKDLLDLFDWFTDYQKEYGLMDLADVEGKEGWMTRPTDEEEQEQVITKQRKAEAAAGRKRTKAATSIWDDPQRLEDLKFQYRQDQERATARKAQDAMVQQYRDRQAAEQEAEWERQGLFDEGIEIMAAALMECVRMMETVQYKTLLEEIERGEIGSEILEYIQ